MKPALVRSFFFQYLALFFLLSGQAVSQTLLPPTSRLSLVEPKAVGMDSSKLSGIANLVEQGIAQAKMPGCVVLVARKGKIAYLKAFGNRFLGQPEEPMTIDTVFDLASLTKPVATATAVMMLESAGELQLDASVASYLPKFGNHGKESITIRQMLVHQSGLIPDNSLKDYQDGPEVAWEKIFELSPIYPIGKQFKYSDVNFLVLAKLVEQISGEDIHRFTQRRLFVPLGMSETGYLPVQPLRKRAAVTQQRDGDWMRGEVHDPRAHALGGIAGHAGLFSTADDLAIYAQMMLERGSLEVSGQKVEILPPDSVEKMTAAYRVSRGTRGLGWDKQSPYSSNRGSRLSASAFGHGGFTGTVMWIDPDLELTFIFLSNRVHPDGKGSVNSLAGSILDGIVDAIITN